MHGKPLSRYDQVKLLIVKIVFGLGRAKAAYWFSVLLAVSYGLLMIFVAWMLVWGHAWNWIWGVVTTLGAIYWCGLIISDFTKPKKGKTNAATARSLER